MSGKKVLVLGATGAMGQYLIPFLAEAGYQVDGVAMDRKESSSPRVRYLQADAKNLQFLEKQLAEHYDGIVDFLIYPTEQLCRYIPRIAAATDHYIYLSSYRIYDDKEHPVRESSPRLLDTADNIMLRNSDDYCVYKARGENIVRVLPRKNWTIVRPAITYSYLRYQLVTLEAYDTVGRAFAGKTVVVPEQARNVQATMSWGGDVARMIGKLLFNDRAIGETFSVATAEHHTWGEIADYYREICGLRTRWVDKEEYIRIRDPDPFGVGARWQLECDRLFSRVMDNSKVLAATGMRQEEMTKLFDGLSKEIARCPKDYPWEPDPRMDAYLEGKL